MTLEPRSYAFGAFNSLQAKTSYLVFRVVVPPGQAAGDELNRAACRRLRADDRAYQALGCREVKLRRPRELEVQLGSQSVQVDLGQRNTGEWQSKIKLGLLCEDDHPAKGKLLYSFKKHGTVYSTEALEIPPGGIQQCIITAEVRDAHSVSMLTVEHRAGTPQGASAKDPLIGSLDFLFVPDPDIFDGE